MKTSVSTLGGFSGRVRRIGLSIFAAALIPLSAEAAPAAKDGDGTMSVSPATAVAGRAGSWAFAFRNANRGPFNAGSQLELSIPAGWTAPQSVDSGAPGFVGVVSTAGVATASIGSISGSGPWTVLVDFTAGKGTANGFDLEYADAAPSAAGTYSFAVRTRQAGGSFVAVGSSPAVEAIKAPAVVTLGGLIQTVDGTPRVATVETEPEGLAVAVTYDGSAEAPVLAGAYAVVATVEDAAYEGAASGTLVVREAGGGDPVYGLETFDNFTHAGSDYASGSFLGQDGSVWTYAKARGDLSISGQSPTLEKAKGAFLRSGTILGGVGTISLKYRKAAVQNVACDVFVNGAPAGTILGGDGTAQTWTSDEVNVMGDVVLMITNNVNGGAITVDDIEWTSCKTPATVTLGGLDRTYDGAPQVVAATTDPAGLAVAVAYDGSDVAPTEAGSYAVVATVADATYAGSASGTLVVAKADQSIDFPAIGDQLATSELTLAATASSGLPVDFSVASGSALIAGTQLTFTGEGPVWVVASQPGDANWNPAPEASNGFAVVKAPAGLTLDDLNQSYDGTPRTVGVATVPGGLAVDLTYDGEPTPPVAAGSYAVVAAVNDARYQGTAAGTLVVAKASATLTLGDLAQTYDGTPKSASAIPAPAGLAVEVTYGGSAVPPVAAGSYLVSAMVVDPNYAGVAAGTLVVAQASQTIEFPAVGDQLTTNVVVLAATASSGLPVAFAVASGPARVDGTQLTFTGEGAVSVVASQPGDANWNPAPNAACAFNVRFPPHVPQISASTVNVREGGDGRFFVRLDRAPAGDVVVAVSRSGGDENLAVASGAALTFGPVNWNWWQAVTLAAAEDENGDGETATFRISAPEVSDQFVVATALDDDVGENLALAAGGSEIAGTAAARCAMAIDGISVSPANYGYTIWTNAPRGTMTLNLNSTARVSRVRILNWNWLYPVAHRYRIESSLDGVVWSNLVDASGSEHSGWDDWVVDDRRARYLRFVGLSNSANAVVCIPEWEVYGQRNPLPWPVLSQTNVNVREGGDGRFYVRLDCDPNGRTVVVDISRFSGEADVAVKSGETRIFTSDNWNVWQAVTLGANEDVNVDNETARFRISTPEVPDRYLEATVLDDDIGANLALASAGATISGVSALRPAMAIDGIHADRANYACTTYLNVEPDGTMTLDLQAATELGRIRLLNWDWIYRTQGYVIESSLDGATWTPLVDASMGGHVGWEDWEVSATARYLRFTGLYNSADKPVIVSEWEVYGPPPARRSLAPAKGGSVVAESEPISVLTSDGPEDETGWNAVDGDEATAWVGQKAGGGYVVIEYSPALELSALEVDLVEGSLTHVQYLYSADGTEWQPLPDDMESNPVSLNYLWLVFPDDGATAVPQVLEIVPNP